MRHIVEGFIPSVCNEYSRSSIGSVHHITESTAFILGVTFLYHSIRIDVTEKIIHSIQMHKIERSAVIFFDNIGFFILCICGDVDNRAIQSKEPVAFV